MEQNLSEMLRVCEEEKRMEINEDEYSELKDCTMNGKLKHYEL